MTKKHFIALADAIEEEAMYTGYNRLDTRRGVIEKLPFCDIDGSRFDVRFERGEGVAYTLTVALSIVNYWNSMNALQPTKPAYVYWID